MADDKKPSSLVGYARPPRATQFKPGQSGNAKGRPKGAKNFATVIADELKSRIVVTENGKRKSISKGEAIAKQLVNKSVTGDSKPLPLLLNEIRAHESRTIEEPGRASALHSPEDQSVVENMIKRIREAKDVNQDPESLPDSALERSVPASAAADSEPAT
jgi:hypothetical protein